MYKNKKIMALIPARSGSKGLPGKNITPLLGKPLIAWTIEQAKKARYVDKIIVSTDSVEIAAVSRRYGAQTPFLRPKELARDDSPTVDVVLHALDWFKDRGEDFDYLALLEPTSPLRKEEDIDNGIKKLVENPDSDTLITLGEVHLEHPMIIKKVRDGLVVPYGNSPVIYQRQQQDKAYFPYGILYLAKVESLYRNKTFYAEKTIPLFIERWQNYEIDDQIDLIIVERIMKGV